MRHMNLWARLGVVLAALWVLATGVYLADIFEHCTQMVRGFGCSDYIVLPYVPAVLPLWRLGVWGDVVALVMAPPLIAWGAFAVLRWIIAGRKISN
jgi:hypothetical protein